MVIEALNDGLFISRVLVSFFVGGSFIVLVAKVAERFGALTGGIVASIPSTALMGSIFLGLSEGQLALRDSAPGTMTGICSSILFFVAYNRVRSKIAVLPAIFGGMLAWFSVVILLRAVKLDSLPVTIVLYFLAVLFALFMYRKIDNDHQPQLAKSTWKSYLLRGTLSGLVVAAIVVVARLAGGFWGGVVGGVPLMWLSNVIILERSQGPGFTAVFLKNTPLASLSTACFVVSVGVLAPLTGLTQTVLAALLLAAIVSVSLLAIKRRALTSVDAITQSG